MEWITCESVNDESWRRLLEYANTELTYEAIEEIHGPASNKSNYLKQAEQVRVSLLQAKEYFDAAQNASLYTKANHLYYGAVSLSTACMLIRGDGSKSLDYLRTQPNTAHHGLEFTFSSNIKSAKKGLDLLQKSSVKVREKGHFINWYETLENNQAVYALHTKENHNGSSTSLTKIGQFAIPTNTEIVGEKRSLEELLKRIPDLFSALTRYGVTVNAARGTHNLFSRGHMDMHRFIFHHAHSSQTLQSLFNQFECSEGINFEMETGETSENMGIVRTRSDKAWPFSYPDSRTTLDHKDIYYVESVNTPEVVDLFLLAYSLSMLSRYYPDIWVSFLESHCKGTKLIEQLVRIISLKLPLLMLNQMAVDDCVISNHRPIWY